MEPHSLPYLPHLRGRTAPRWPSERLAKNGEAGNWAVAVMQSWLHATGQSSPRVRHDVQGCWESSLAQGGGERVREAAALWGASPPLPDMRAARC